MTTFAIAKVLSALPGTLEPNTMYCVRVGAGVDFYMTDDSGQIAYKQNADTSVRINAQSGTSYTLTADDAGTIVRLTNTSAITLTVPAGVFGQGEAIGIQQGGVGQVTVMAGSGVSAIETTATLKTAGPGALVGLICHTAGTGFSLTGDRAAP